MPRDDQKSITVPEDTYEQLQREREERGSPKWGVFFEQLLAGPETPTLDVPEDLDAWREHGAGSDEIKAVRREVEALAEQQRELERRIDDLPTRIAEDISSFSRR